MDFGLVEVGEGVDSLPVREYKDGGRLGLLWRGGENSEAISFCGFT
jgi:hypothetical protein